MAPPTQNEATVTEDSQYRFVYKGVEYDATHFVKKHPGGLDFLRNMKSERSDITEYFKALHSEDAQKLLKSFPVLQNLNESKESKDYFELLKQVEHLYQPNWLYESLFTLFTASTFLIGCFSTCWYLAAFCFGISMIIQGWCSHSRAHSRHRILQFLGKVTVQITQRSGALIGGYCESWWSPKHNMHHMFTNSERYDDDIKHAYKLYLYPFLYLKWRFDSAMEAIKSLNMFDIPLIFIQYYMVSYQSIWIFLLGQLVAGFYSANVLIGNHEREQRFKGQIQIPFMEHQTVTCRNYRQQSFLWLALMGGMQFQTQHHLFPQIVFYNLPKSAPIIREFLKKKDLKVIYGPVL